MEIALDFFQNNKQRVKPLGLFALIVLGLYGLNHLFKSNSDQDEQQQNNAGKHPAGILNEGNTCFVNSLLQALASVESFKSNIESLLKIHASSDDNEDLIIELSKIIKKINNGSNTENISAMDLLDILSKSQAELINFQQQDTYELYSAFVRAFDQFFNKRKQANLSISNLSLNDQEIENCLLGYTKSTIECMTCKNTMTIKNHSFYDLSLQIQPNFITSLKSALLWYERKQKIQSYACTFCSIKAHVQKLERIRQRLESIKWNEELSEANQKIIHYLKHNSFQDMDLKEINMVLEQQVTQFTDIFTRIGDNPFRNQIFSLIKPVERDIIKQTKITKYPKVLVIHLKQLIINPYTGQPAYMRKPIDYSTSLAIEQRTHTNIYKLTSLLTHIGNQNMGHYFTFRKATKDTDQWFLISDTHTEKVSQMKMKRHVPYMLFFQLDQEDYGKNQNARSMRELQVQEQKKIDNKLKENNNSVNRLSLQLCAQEDNQSQKVLTTKVNSPEECLQKSLQKQGQK